MELLLVQLDIACSETIEEVPQILVMVKVSLFISVPLPNDSITNDSITMVESRN